MHRRTETAAAAVLALAAALLPVLARGQDTTPAATSEPAAASAAPEATLTANADAGSGGPAAKPANHPSELESTKEQLSKLPSAADLKPSGPITINANHAELVQNNSAVYSGNVTLDSDTLKMDGDRVELKRAADGPYTARVTGAPAHMSHAGDGPDNPPVSAHAKLIVYDSRSAIIDLIGDAQLTRGDDKTTADTIRYYVQERRYEASGSESGSGRVTIVIPQLNSAVAPAKAPPAGATAPAAPQPAAPATPAPTEPSPAAPPKPQIDSPPEGGKP
jgi:lipopolysaccharide transport protein LptA